VEGTSRMGPFGACHTYLLGCVCGTMQRLAAGSRTSSRARNCVSFSMGPYGALHASGNILGTASTGGYLLYGTMWSSPYISRLLCLCYPAKIQDFFSGQLCALFSMGPYGAHHASANTITQRIEWYLSVQISRIGFVLSPKTGCMELFNGSL